MKKKLNTEEKMSIANETRLIKTISSIFLLLFHSFYTVCLIKSSDVKVFWFKEKRKKPSLVRFYPSSKVFLYSSTSIDIDIKSFIPQFSFSLTLNVDTTDIVTVSLLLYSRVCKNFTFSTSMYMFV